MRFVLHATLVAIVAACSYFAPRDAGAQQWVLMDGAARDVGVGSDGSVWIIGANPVPGGYDIYRRKPDNSGWTNIPGGAERVAVGPDGNAWVINNTQTIFRYDGSKWLVVPGQARDVAVGPNGTVWIIGNNVEPGGYGIYRSTNQGASWTKIPGSALRIAVDARNNAWVVNNTSNIFRFDGNTWVMTTGAAKDIGAGPDGAVWVIGSDGGILRWDGSANWVRKTGGARDISVGPNGIVWVVNDANQIWRAQEAQQAAAPAPATLPAGQTLVLTGQPITVNVDPNLQVTGATTAGTSGGLVMGSGSTVVSSAQPLVVSGMTAIPQSGPACGGIVNGVAQPRCAPVKAEYISKSRNECSSGFFDLTTWSCWSCPAGFVRSAAPVISEQACSKTSGQQLQRIAAQFIGPRCPAGSFFDPIRGGECWSCPGGYNRSAAHIEASNACYVPIREVFSGTTRHKSTMWPHECSSGTFWDGYNGGACYSCPSGYRRTAYAVWDGKACAQTLGEQHSRATFVRKGECEAGTIFDPRNGGECWKCPEGALRTIFPVNENAACERPAGVTFASATKIAPLTCEPGDHFDPIDGGTCWRCPTGYDRTASSVKASDACKTNTMQWRSATYREPGLFQLDGASEVLVAIAQRNRPLVKSTLETVARKLSEQTGTPLAQVRAEQQAIFINQPQDSLVAHAVVYTRLVAAIADPARSSAIEKRLVASFRQHVIDKRTYIARDMLAAYYAWKESDDYWRSQYNLNRGLAGTMYYGTVPPSFDKLGMAVTTGIGATSTVTSMVIEKSFEALQFAKAAQRLPILGDVLGVALSASTAGWTPATSGETIALQLTRSAGEVALGQAIGQLLTFAAQVPAWTIVTSGVAASVPVAALSTAGPQIIVAGGMILASIAIDQYIQISEAEPKLKNAIVTAQADPDLTRMSKTKDGLMQLQTYWSYAMGGVRVPDAAFMQTWKVTAPAAFT